MQVELCSFVITGQHGKEYFLSGRIHVRVPKDVKNCTRVCYHDHRMLVDTHAIRGRVRTFLVCSLLIVTTLCLKKKHVTTFFAIT